MNRRQFIRSGACLSLSLLACSCSSLRPGKASRRIAFNTANLVGRVSGYRYELKNWGQQHQSTIALTDEKAWAGICADISAAGYRAVEIWEAHASPEELSSESKAKTWKKILSDHDLQPIAYAGGLRRETLQVCRWLGIPHIDGGLRGLAPDPATKLCSEFKIGFNLENHPQKTLEEILKPIGGGNEWLGVCVDTGWLGTQGANSAEMIRRLGSLVRHAHIKDVRQAGTHETCRLGDGVVDIPSALKALADINYAGWYSWEDEPEDRNPLELARWTLDYLQTRI